MLFLANFVYRLFQTKTLLKKPDLTSFPKSNLNDWIEVAEKQLKKENPMEALSWESHGLGSIKPFYENADLDPLSDQIAFFQKLPHHQWKLYEEIIVNSEAEANQKALDALAGGCDGVFFHTQKVTDMAQLIKDIDASICDVSVVGAHDVAYSNSMNSENTVIEKQPSLSPRSQILWILENVNERSNVLRHAFTDFFVEIASIRALKHCLMSERNSSDLHVHTRIPLNNNTEYQWFLNTTAGLASILGGSHSISMPTAIGDPRITRNVGNLIRDESKIETYTDQCGGSYYVESLTAKIIESVKAEVK